MNYIIRSANKNIAGSTAGVYNARDTAVVRLVARQRWQNFRVHSAKGGVVVYKVPPLPLRLPYQYYFYVRIYVLIYLLYTYIYIYIYMYTYRVIQFTKYAHLFFL